MYELKIKSHFDAAHQLKDYQGKCSQLHGHRWDVEVCVSGTELLQGNLLLDFSVLKKVLNTVLDRFDHHFLNEVLENDNPTAELLSMQIYSMLAESGTYVDYVRVWESPDCSATYYEET